MSSRSRNVVFTVNSIDGERLRLLDPELWPGVTFCVYSREFATREHFQGYMEFDTAQTWSGLHLLDGLADAHFESRRGTQAQAISYAQKVDDPSFLEGPFIFGEKKSQGQRNELLVIQRDLDQGASLRDIARDNFPEYIRFRQSFQSYQRLMTISRDWVMDIRVYVGPTGCGKTRKAMEEFGDDIYLQVHDKWWDGYTGQQTVLIDEMYGSRFKWAYLLQLCDRYPFSVEAKGSVIEFTSRRIIFTSNLSPELWYPNKDFSPLKRRINHTVTWTTPEEVAPIFLFNGVPTAFSRTFRVPE